MITTMKSTVLAIMGTDDLHDDYDYCMECHEKKNL